MKTYSVFLIFLLTGCIASQQAAVEKDPVFTASASFKIQPSNITYWNQTGDTVKWAVYRKTETYSRSEIDAKIASVQGGGGTIDAYTKKESDLKFAPFTHVHTIGNIANLQSSLDAKANVSSTATKQQLTDSITKLNKTIELQNININNQKNTIDDLNNRLKKIEKFLYDDTTHYGVLINGDMDIAKKASIVKDSLKANYVRYDLNINLWTGKNKGLETLAAKGLKIVLNLNTNNNDVDIAYEKDLNKYRKFVSDVLDKYGKYIAFIVLENEPYNYNAFHHNGNIDDYIALIKVAADECHKRGIKVTDGGLYGPQIEVLTYRYLRSQNRFEDAAFFADQCMVRSQIRDAEQFGRNQQTEKEIDDLIKILQADAAYCDYVNFHVYTDTLPGTNKFLYPQLAFTADCFRFYTGLETISNETCQRHNTSPGIVLSMMMDFKYAGYKYAIWFSGDDGMAGSMSLVNKDGSLRANGKAFRDYKFKLG